jgi:hypothetical protein
MVTPNYAFTRPVEPSARSKPRRPAAQCGRSGANMFRAASVLLGSLLVVVVSQAMSDTAREEYWVKSSLEGTQTVILVRVVASTFHPGDSALSSSSIDERAKVSVLKSWKGPFSAGNVVHVAPNIVCTGSCGSPFDLQNGEEVLIFTNSTEDPIALGAIRRGTEAQAAIATLDQAVREQRELEDPQTDLIRAPERNRVVLALKKCFADASTNSKIDLYPNCEAMDVSVLRGMKRSALVTNLGPPKWCRRWNTSGRAEYSSHVGTDCPPEQMPIWSFRPRDTSGSGLWCSPERNLRCMGLGWIGVSGE